MREYTQFYINGQWVDPVTPKTLEVLDPSTEEPCATISLGTEADVDLAVAAAKAAFETFSQTSVEERVGMLERMAEIFQRRIGEIAEAIRDPGASGEQPFGRRPLIGAGVLIVDIEDHLPILHA